MEHRIYTSLELAQLIEAANVHALESHGVILRRLFPKTEPATLHVGGGVASFVGAPPVSYAVGLGMDGMVEPEDIAQVVEFYRSRGAVPRVDVCPFADESLFAALRAHNFRLHSFVNVLVRPLAADEKFASPAGVVIRQAQPEEAEAWVKVTDECFSGGSPITDTRYQLGMLIFHGDANVPYLAEVDGKIVAAGAMFMHGPYAALTSAAVREPFRRRGIHAALIRARLSKAQQLGATVAGIFVLPGNGPSHRNAERHGFQVAYTKAIMKAD